MIHQSSTVALNIDFNILKVNTLTCSVELMAQKTISANFCVGKGRIQIPPIITPFFNIHKLLCLRSRQSLTIYSFGILGNCNEKIFFKLINMADLVMSLDDSITSKVIAPRSSSERARSSRPTDIFSTTV